jgi:hypothetical protein
MVNQNILLHGEIFRNIRAAFTTTVYAFLSPGRPSAARDFFLPGVGGNRGAPVNGQSGEQNFF